MTFLFTALVLYLVWTFVQCYNQRDRLFLLEKTTGDETESVLVATWQDGDIPTGCEILTDKDVVDNIVSTSDSAKIRSLSEDDMKLLLDDCSEFNSKGEKLESMVEASTRMSIRDIIRNSHQEFRRRNGEDRTSQNRRQGRRNSSRKNDSRVNDIETTTSLTDMKTSMRENVRSVVINRYSTEAPGSAIERYPSRENSRRTSTGRNLTAPTRSTVERNSSRDNARRTTTSRNSTVPTRSTIEMNPAKNNSRSTTIGRYPTEPARSAVERNSARGNTRRTTPGRYPTEPTRSAVERNTARDNARRTTIRKYPTESTRRAIERSPTRENARRTTTSRYPAESTARSSATGRTRSFNVRTTTSENNLETTTMATSSSTVPGYDGIPIIMPGTKWCGAGDIAQHEKDFGRSEETDKCCRAHDHCNDTLAPGETRGNLTNDSSFTLLSCQCDEEFYDCLDSSNSIISNTVGNLYFNILGRKCYKKDYPTVCKKYYTFFHITCREYGSDTSQKRGYNWYPAKRYRKIFTK